MFAKIENGVPVEWGIPNIRQRFPQISFPTEITDSVMPDGYVIVRAAAAPQPEPGQKAVPAAPVLADGKWVAGWTLVDMSPEEIAERNQALVDEIVGAVQERLDDFSRTRNYDGILSACTYATSSVPKFQAEGQYAVSARDSTWAKLYAMLAEVEAGTRPIPTGYADIVGELPQLEWPQ